MPFALTMPKLSPTMSEGVIAKWHKKAGDFVEAGDLLLEISTDKATIEYNAIDPGWMRKVFVDEGQKADVNAPLAIFSETENEPIPEEVAVPAPQAVQPTSTLQKEAPKPQKDSPSSRTLASPLAKKLAQERGIRLEGLQGSGPRGRIMSRDLETAQKSQTKEKPSADIRTETLSSMRQVIAKRLQESKSTIPHFYVSINVNAKKLVEMREEMKAGGLSITVNDFVVRAAAMALMQHPVVRSTFDPKTNTVSYLPHADVCVAVSINGGLITPIVTRAEEKTLSAISREVKELVEKAKANKLAPHEFMGGAFTISNLGMFGVTEFQAIINPPQVAILAVGAALDAPVIDSKGHISAGKVLKLTLSCDHRVVDGTDGARFLQTMKTLLESPSLILV